MSLCDCQALALCFYLVASWDISRHLLCSGDIESNPGPLNEEGVAFFLSLLESCMQLASTVFKPVLDPASLFQTLTEEEDDSEEDDEVSSESFDIEIINEVSSMALGDDELEMITASEHLISNAAIPEDSLEVVPEDDSMQQLLEVLIGLKDTFSGVERTDQEVLALHVCSREGAIEELYALAFNIFESTQGMSCHKQLAQVYFAVTSNVEGWADVSVEVSKRIAYGGLLIQNINDLLYFMKSPLCDDSQIVQSAIEAQLGVVYNCARNYPLPEFYYGRFKWDIIISDVLSSYSNIAGIRITCKLLATTLPTCFQQVKLLDMATDDLSTLISALAVAATSPNQCSEAFGYLYSAMELLFVIQALSSSHKITDDHILPPVLELVNRGETHQRVAALKFLWHILEQPEIKEAVRTTHKGILSVLEKDAREKEEGELSLWCNGVLASAGSDTSLQGIIATAKCCYSSGKYAQCMELSSNVPELVLLKGKSLYHLYQMKQRVLQKSQGALDYKEHHNCYEMARETIKILGHARDIGGTGMDETCQKMLDFAMMDYILETNNLKGLKRCFLCLEKQDDRQATHREQGSETEGATAMVTNEAVPLKQKGADNIKKSHLFPRSLIEKLAADDTKCTRPSKNIIFGTYGMKPDSKRTPKTATLYMLCGICEHAMNIKGEQPFLSFFEKMVHPANIFTKQELVYGKELYYFCLSLIFRTLCPSQVDYINTDEVYQLLVHCRTYLLKGPVSSEREATGLPQIFLYVHPISDSASDTLKTTFTEHCSVSYTSKTGLDCTLDELHSFESVYANFFLVKVGLLIILVRFKPAMKWPINIDNAINPCGGLYIVPANSNRMEAVPVGVKTALHLLYKTYATDLECRERSEDSQ